MEFQKAIEEVTRYMDLKPKQLLEAVKSFVSGQDTFVALLMGYGKSVIFAVLSLWLIHTIHNYRINGHIHSFRTLFYQVRGV